MERALGRKWAVVTFIADALKGFIPAYVIPRLPVVAQDDMLLAVLCGGAAIAGHVWPIYLRFKGGKGVATSAGVVLGIAPLAVILGLLLWSALFFTTRYVSLASVVVALFIPAFGWFTYRDEGYLLPVALTLLGVLVIIRHRSNIRRLLDGTENKFVRKDRSA